MTDTKDILVGGSTVGGSAITVIAVQGWAHRHGIDLSPDEAIAYGGLLLGPYHYLATMLGIFATGSIARFQRWWLPPTQQGMTPVTTAS